MVVIFQLKISFRIHVILHGLSFSFGSPPSHPLTPTNKHPLSADPLIRTRGASSFFKFHRINTRNKFTHYRDTSRPILPPEKSKRKKPDTSCQAWCWRRPIFPCSLPQSIVGADELNYCVRNGNRWTLVAKNTNYLC